MKFKLLVSILITVFFVFNGCSDESKTANKQSLENEIKIDNTDNKENQTKGENLRLFTNSFEHKKPIPAKYTCDGEGIAPDLRWENTTSNTKSFVLIMDDPDAVGGIWDHWVVYNIPANVDHIKEGGILPDGAKVGKSTNGKNSYVAPCPPKGTGVHNYTFKLYALDIESISPSNDTKRDIEEAMHPYILDETTLIGRYEKKKKFLFF